MGKIKRILMIVIAFLFFAAAIYLAWQWKNSQSTHSSSSNSSEWKDLNPSDTSFTPSGEVLNGNLDNIAEPADWKIYKNQKFGFSMNVPQRVLGIDKCKSTKFEASTVILEDFQTSSVFIAPEYYFDNYTPSTTQVVDNSEDITFIEDDPINTGDPNLSDFNGDGVFDCRKKFYTLPLVKYEILGNSSRSSKIPLLGNPFAGIALRAAQIDNTAELDHFIQDVFGAGCVLSKKEAWSNQEGVYQLEIKNTGNKDSKGRELPCATEKVTDILYNPTKNRLIYIYLPSSGVLFSDESEGYDEEMVASIRFY